MVIKSSSEHKSLTILISLTNIKKIQALSLRCISLFGRKKIQKLWFMWGEVMGKGGVPRGKKFGNNYPKQLSKRILVNAVG